MKIQKRTKTKKTLLIPIPLVVLLIAACVFAYLYTREAKSPHDAPKQDSSFESDRKQSQDLKDNYDSKQQAPNADKPATPTTNAASDKKQVQLTASTNTANNTVYIRGGINYPVAEGVCYAQLVGPSGQSIRKESALLRNPASTDCKTIAIPASDLSPGSWTFTLHYESDSYEGVSSEVSFSV